MSFSAPLDPDSRVSRRRFLEVAATITAMCSVRTDLWAIEERNGIPYKNFGRTGEKVSAIGLGGRLLEIAMRNTPWHRAS